MNICRIFLRSILKSLDNRLLETSGYIAYTSIISFFPFMILLISTASLFGQTEQTQYFIYQFQSYVPHEVADVVLPIVKSLFDRPTASLITFSIVGLVWAAASGIESLRFGLNEAYELKERRSFLKRYLQNFLMIMVLLTAVMILSVMLIVIPTIYQYFPQLGEDVQVINMAVYVLQSLDFEGWVDSIAFVGGIFLVFSTLYYYIPNLTRPVGHIFPGALLAAVLFVSFSSIFSYYLDNFADYVSVYKALAGVVVLLLFVQFSTFIFLLGAQFNRELTHQRTN